MLVGTQLGSYHILEEVGRGGMATVYRARQESMDRDVAIKIIQRGLSDPAAVQRFQREARLIARLEHPHILPVYDFDGAHDPPYIVMRFLEGGTLEDILARGMLPLDEVASVMRQLCAGLDYAHRQGVIHRDIKPSNILVDRDGNAFVSDFGIARSAAGPTSMRLTQEGMVLGSVEYMSPEQVMGRRDLDFRADLYALGAMLFQMLTGRLPYVSDPPLGVLAMHMSAPIPSACALNPALNEAVDEVIQRVLAKKPEDRFRNAVEMSAALDAALGAAAVGLPATRDYLREMAGLPAPGRALPEPTMGMPFTEHNKQIVAAYINAAEFAEMVEAIADRETAYREMVALWEGVERIVKQAGGVALSRTDSDMLAVWGVDAVREDDAERAVRAALEIQSVVRKQAGMTTEDEQLPVNVGIHAGMALVSPITQPDARTGAYTVSGATISLSNRLMQSAYGSILITHDVYRQVRGVFEVQPDLPLRVRGRAEGVPTYRVSAAKPRAFRPNTRGIDGIETRMVGREAELKRLQYALLNAVEDAETQVVTITGEPGVGKSRLMDTFDSWSELRPEMFFLFRGRAAGTSNRPYALLRDMIAFRFQIRDDDSSREVVRKLEEGVDGMIRSARPAPPGEEVPVALTAHRIGHLCGYDVSASSFIQPLSGDPALLATQARKTFIDFVFYLARCDYVVFELEDLHLADDASLDLLNELFAFCANRPEDTHLMVACAARLALYSRRPEWGRGQPFHTRIDLQPLDRREARELVREILRKVTEVPRALRDLLVERAEGNPYYLEELVKMLIDDRVILPESDTTWRVEESRLGALKVPPSLAALIEARLDTLLAPERLVLLRAAVFGRIFFSGVLEAMDSADVANHGTGAHIADLPGVLEGLVRRQFIHAHEHSAFAGSGEFIFAQSLLRDVVYDLLLDRQRRIYHRATADWLSSLERSDEYQVQIADHLEQAGEWDEAAQALARAGERAHRRGLFREAETLYERGLADLTGDDPIMRLVLLLGLGAAANGRGDLPKARPALEEALTLAQSIDDSGAQASARYLLGMVDTAHGKFPTALAQFDQALPLARDSRDPRVLANVLYGLAETAFRSGDNDRAMQAGEECCLLAEDLGDEALKVLVLNRIATVHMMRFEYDRSLALVQKTLPEARAIGHHRAETALLINLGVLHMLGSNFTGAVQAWESAMPILRETGDLFAYNITTANLAVAYVRVGALEKVCPMVRESIRAGRQMHSLSGQLRGILGKAELLLAQGDLPGGFALMGLARSHPAAAADHVWGADRGLTYWRERLRMTEDQTAPMLATGKNLDLENVIQEALAE